MSLAQGRADDVLQERQRRQGRAATKRRIVPLLPLRDIIVFPHMVSQLFVGRERSINALDAAMARDKDIFLAAQKNAKTNEPTPEDIFAGRHARHRSCSSSGCPTAR